ncbi:malate dehydrogenase [Blattella germanica]|nr:malate dehydrogenase [Blattella germanica]
MAPNLIYLIAKGEVFGERQPLVLHLIDTPNHTNTVRGVAMEFMDSGFPLLKDCIATNKLSEAFEDIDVAFLLPYPDLTVQKSRLEKLGERLSLAKLHGEALNLYAKKTVKVVVVGHYANIWTIICSQFAPTIPAENFTGVSRFVQNFAASLLSLRLRVRVEDIKDIIVWGNYSEKMHTDLCHATVKMPLADKETGVYVAMKNDHWLKGEYNEIIHETTFDVSDNKRCISMAVSAAEHMRDWWQGTKPDQLTSMIVVSNGAYDVPKGLFFSFPVVIKDKKWKILEVKGFS